MALHQKWSPIVIVAILGVALLSWQNAEAGAIRAGVNHHLGDDSFVAAFHRPPDSRDSEALRMQTHLKFVRKMFSQRQATSPTLQSQRETMLRSLDDYIAKGSTPRNLHVGHRSPVFIDDDGTICAVGYLIERSVGRGLAEQIALQHRHDYLEDIAADMPEVANWVAASGFTLTELASIQPGYQTEIDSWVSEPSPKISGKWVSKYPSGQVLAKGQYKRHRPAGQWTFYHPSGRIAAKGRLVEGRRHGTWVFYYDNDAHAVMSRGRMQTNTITGEWRHFDIEGRLLAITNTIVDDEHWDGGGHTLTFRGPHGSVYQSIQGSRAGDSVDVLASIVKNDLRIYKAVERDQPDDSAEVITTKRYFDDQGQRLTRTADGWQASKCAMTREQRRLINAHNVAALALSMSGSDRFAGDCQPPVAVGRDRSQQIDELIADVRMSDKPVASVYKDHQQQGLIELLESNMAWHIEWPTVDKLTIAVYATLPGFSSDFM
jgi:hypothetical protein